MITTSKTNLTRAAAGLFAVALISGTAAAREPGILPTIPSGASMGVPIAAPAPAAGIAASSRTGLSFQHFYDAGGNKTPTEITIRDTVLQFAIVPDNQLLGGQYRAFLSIPFIDIESENIPTPFGPANGSSSGLGSIELRPVDISWRTAPDVFINAGLSVFTPGDWDATRLVNPSQNFWSISPSVGISYLRDGWNASAHLIYFSNFENTDNGYTSGDEVHLNLTAMKAVGNGWSVGGVGYLREQVSSDKNPDGAYGGALGGDALQRGSGLSVTKQVGPMNFNAMYTTDLSIRNSGGGDRVWLNAIIPLKRFGQ